VTVANPHVTPQDVAPRDPLAPSAPVRDGRGRFLPGNLAAVSHALRAETLPPELAHLPAEIDAWMASVAADEGNPDDVSTRRRALLEYRGRLHRRVVQLDTALELRGLVDKRGKLRVAWLQQLSSLITTAKALDMVLGLERKARKVGTVSELLS
jgi:hypothetical protein